MLVGTFATIFSIIDDFFLLDMAMDNAIFVWMSFFGFYVTYRQKNVLWSIFGCKPWPKAVLVARRFHY